MGLMKDSIKTKLDEMAYARDGFKCVECGKTIGIEAHHIIPELEKLDNLVTLCHACHKKKHNMAGCFKQGKDDRRNKGIQSLAKINKTHYYNRYIKQWIEHVPA